jgi:hypothetical protein
MLRTSSSKSPLSAHRMSQYGSLALLDFSLNCISLNLPKA